MLCWGLGTGKGGRSPKFIWAPCHVMCTAVPIGWDPATPPPSPSIWTRITRAILVSKDRRHLFVTPCLHLCSFSSEDLSSPTGQPASNFSVGGEVLARSPIGSVADLSGDIFCLIDRLKSHRLIDLLRHNISWRQHQTNIIMSLCLKPLWYVSGSGRIKKF